jgi:hypothetical protein
MSIHKSLLHKEIYLVAGDEDDDPRPIFIAEDLPELKKYLASLLVANDFDIRVLHGVLVPARVLPSKLKGKTAFLVYITEQTEDVTKAAVVEGGDSAVILAEEVEFAVKGIPEVEIDNTFILYGYELQTYLTVMEDDHDDEAIDTCLDIAKKCLEVSRRLYEKVREA